MVETLTLALIISGSDNRCSTSGGEYFDRIPVDLVIKILSKLSSKSMAKCRCVSKLWSSTIRSPNYKQLFPINSVDPPRFLFTFLSEGKLSFYTSSQHQNPDKNSSLVATLHHTNSLLNANSRIHHPVNGLVCHERTADNYTTVVIYNPITGQSVTLPKVKAESNGTISYFGYDPINKQFKVMCTTWVFLGARKNLSLQHQIITLDTENGNHFWRKIHCCKHYNYTCKSDEGICINGVLYYPATAVNEKHVIVCFDVRSEKFDFFTWPWTPSILINYNGKLGAVDNFDDKDFVLRVLEDAEKHIWSKHIYEKPLQWRKLISKYVWVLGVTSRGEFVFSPKYTAAQDSFYIYYYLPERNIVVSVKVEEVPAYEEISTRWTKINVFPNYVEDVKLM